MNVETFRSIFNVIFFLSRMEEEYLEYYCHVLMFQQTREQIDKGYRLPPPSGTPPQIFEIMQRCWNANDSLRPHFSEIVITLGNMREIFGD